MISDEILKQICDKVENSLENYVLVHRGQLLDNGEIIEGGMEGQIKKQYDSRLSSMVLSKGERMESLTNEQKEYIKKRLEDTLELSKKQYYS